jgi:hypothetical protein
MKKRIFPVFEFDLNDNELDVLDTLVKSCVDQKETILPKWNYMGQDVWNMKFDAETSEFPFEWAIETADVA